MQDTILCSVCTCAQQVAAQTSGLELKDIVTAGISIATLILNILFYIIIAPRISFRFQKKEDFLKYASELIEYLSEVNSLTDFDKVPTKVKSYCVSIELLFKSGFAPEPLRTEMENVFQFVKKRKNLTSELDIIAWEKEFRVATQTLRKELAKYSGVF